MTKILRTSIVPVLAGLWTAVSVATLAPDTAVAQNGVAACAERDMVVDRLDEQYGEHRNNMMLDAQGNLVELFSNLETGSWTLMVTLPGGPTCILSMGESFVQETRTAEADSLGS